MKSEFQAKYLQHLVSKKKNNEGFTLIELLVVIIIVGVLAAIALPSFLNQIGKARGSEATSNLGTIARSQQAYRYQNTQMADQLSLLDARISGKFYTYAIQNRQVNSAEAIARIGNGAGVATDLKLFDSAVNQYIPPANNTNPEFFGQAICESLQNNAVPGMPVVPTQPNVQGTCDTTTSRLVD
jgi:type IV pilus assembly protein PilA